MLDFCHIVHIIGIEQLKFKIVKDFVHGHQILSRLQNYIQQSTAIITNPICGLNDFIFFIFIVFSVKKINF